MRVHLDFARDRHGAAGACTGGVARSVIWAIEFQKSYDDPQIVINTADCHFVFGTPHEHFPSPFSAVDDDLADANMCPEY